MVAYSTAQKQRLTELNADRTVIGREFENSRERDACSVKQKNSLSKKTKQSCGSSSRMSTFLLHSGSRSS